METLDHPDEGKGFSLGYLVPRRLRAVPERGQSPVLEEPEPPPVIRHNLG